MESHFRIKIVMFSFLCRTCSIIPRPLLIFSLSLMSIQSEQHQHLLARRVHEANEVFSRRESTEKFRGEILKN